MSETAYSSYTQWYSEGNLASYLRSMKSSGEMLNLLEADPPAGDNSGPAVPDLVLAEDVLGGSRVSGNLGGGRFDVTSEKGALYLAAPNFARTNIVERGHRIRALSFPLSQWQTTLDEVGDGHFSFDMPHLYGGMFHSLTIKSALRNLWALCGEEGAPSRLLARAAGLEILAELCRIAGAPLAAAKGGLAPWAQRRCLELMHSELSEDISLDALAAEARLSPFHFARMFKHSLGVPPRVYLTRLRIEKACELLEHSDLPVTEIAHRVGYSSNQVLARVFIKHQGLSPSDYRRAVQDPVREKLRPKQNPAVTRDAVP